jgi:hypothetical protein
MMLTGVEVVFVATGLLVGLWAIILVASPLFGSAE